MEQETTEDVCVEYEGFVSFESKAENRVQFLFDGKPNEGIWAILKSNAFKWSPYAGAWQRFLNGNGRYAAKFVIKKITA